MSEEEQKPPAPFNPDKLIEFLGKESKGGPAYDVLFEASLARLGLLDGI
ncbi:hypothetical protein HY468_04210 [Candidatus Roizmanbacteria bacterium]|nr:hypothetical protein [Candidatus Roizmanbacteria bacterium]